MTTPAVRQRTRARTCRRRRCATTSPYPTRPTCACTSSAITTWRTSSATSTRRCSTSATWATRARFAEDLAAGEQAAVELRDSVRRVEDLVLARSDISRLTRCSSSSPPAPTANRCSSTPPMARECWNGSTLAANRSGTACACQTTHCPYPILPLPLGKGKG